VRVGIIGTGNFTKSVFDALQKEDYLTVVGGYESIKADGFINFDSVNELIDAVDIVLVLDLLSCDYERFSEVLKYGKHLYIESPGLLGRRDLSRLELLANEASVSLQIGLKQRFYSFFDDLSKYEVVPRIIESRRHVKFNSKSTQLSVLEDLMVHDVDVALKLVNSDVKSVYSTAVGVYYKDPDIIHTRIEFYNGCVANLSASKIADKETHKTQIFQKNVHCSIDYMNQVINVQSSQLDSGEFREDWGKRTKYNQKKDDYIFMLKREVYSFYDSITNNMEPIAGISQYLQLQSVTDKIKEQLERNFTTNV
jgi:predicted dehydrogenase